MSTKQNPFQLSFLSLSLSLGCMKTYWITFYNFWVVIESQYVFLSPTPPTPARAQTLLYLTHQNLQFHNLTSPYKIPKSSILNKPTCNPWLHCKHHTQTLKPPLLLAQAPIKPHFLLPLASPPQAHVDQPIVINLELQHKDHQWERQSWNIQTPS